MGKSSPPQPTDIPEMFRRIRQVITPYPKAMLFELAAKGFNSPFEQLVACLLSIRTYDETSLCVAEDILTHYRTPESLAALSVEKLTQLVKPCTFPGPKAQSLHRISEILRDHNGPITWSFEFLTSLPGIGLKCTNLVLGIACGIPRIGVDIHVHRVTNRWGFVNAPTPEKTLAQLEERLPREFWVEINELLIPFGKHICQGRLPRCSTCPVFEFCERRGVPKRYDFEIDTMR